MLKAIELNEREEPRFDSLLSIDLQVFVKS